MPDTPPAPQAALTPLEWADEAFDDGAGSILFLGGGEGHPMIKIGDANASGSVDREIRRGSGLAKALAALALYGQPFGFTHMDVKMLRMWAEDSKRDCASRVFVGDMAIESLATRIANLLPPEEEAV